MFTPLSPVDITSSLLLLLPNFLTNAAICQTYHFCKILPFSLILNKELWKELCTFAAKVTTLYTSSEMFHAFCNALKRLSLNSLAEAISLLDTVAASSQELPAPTAERFQLCDGDVVNRTASTSAIISAFDDPLWRLRGSCKAAGGQVRPPSPLLTSTVRMSKFKQKQSPRTNIIMPAHCRKVRTTATT